MRKVLAADGVMLACHVYGAPSAEAPTLFFSHATGFHGRVFETSIRHLTDRNKYYCVSIDHRGHGLSGWNNISPLKWEVFGEV